MATSSVAELRHTCVALAEALSEPGRHFNPDQVMLKGHKINIGQNGTHSSPPETRSNYVDVSLGVLCTPSFIYEWSSRECPCTNNGGKSRMSTHSSPPETRSQYVDVSLGVLCTPSFIYEWTSLACPCTNNGGKSRMSTHSLPPETRSQYVEVSLGVLCTPSFIYEWSSRACPCTNNGGKSRLRRQVGKLDN